MSGNLTHTPGQIIQELLITNLALGVKPATGNDWSCYFSLFPDKPDKAIQVTDTQGRIQGRTHVDGEIQEQHGFQILIRSPADDVTAGYQRAKAIANSLDLEVLREVVVIDGHTYIVQAITRTTDVISIGREISSSARQLFSLNAVVTVTEPGTGN